MQNLYNQKDTIQADIPQEVIQHVDNNINPYAHTYKRLEDTLEETRAAHTKLASFQVFIYFF